MRSVRIGSVVHCGRPPDAVFRGAHRRSKLVDRYGITDHELGGPLWRSPYHGTHTFFGTDPEDPMHRLREAVTVLPMDGALTGWAAAYLHGATDLDGRRWTGGLAPVPFVLPYTRRVRRTGVQTIRAPLDPSDVMKIGHVQVTRPERTCFELMRRGPLEEAVVAVDAMLRGKAVTMDGMATYLAAKRGWNGVPLAREALRLADARAASCPESRLRVCWVVEAGLPKPEVNVPVFSADGRFLGVPDLLDPETGLAGEYDGAHHRKLKQHSDDNVREERLEAYGLTVVRATVIDLRSERKGLRSRLRRGYENAHRRAAGSRRWMTRPLF